MRNWLLERVDWRDPAGFWSVIGWLAGVLWPGMAGTFIIWPPSEVEGGVLLGWRTFAMLAGMLSVSLSLYLIDWERRREGTPRTRLGVIVRFLVFGFVFALIGEVLAALVLAGLALFGPGDFTRNLGEAKATLFMFGFPGLVFALLVGLSWSAWAGVAAAYLSFAPRPPAMRPNHFILQRLLDPEPEPKPQPKPAPPRPETEMEAALRPDWD